MGKYTYEEVVSRVSLINLKPLFNKEWFDNNYKSTRFKVSVIDSQGYKYLAIVKNLLNIYKPRRFHVTNPYTLENVELFLKTNNRSFDLVCGQNYKTNEIKLKWYCRTCNSVFLNRLSGVLHRGNGCCVCANQQISCGVNDLKTIRPDLVKYFKDSKDAEKVFCFSEQKKLLKCPQCGCEKEMIMRQLCKNGFSCPQCSDGISIPNKFVFGILNQLNINFISEYKINNCRYDFYLPDLKITIEAHGMQHYKHTGRGRSLSEEQLNDVQKKSFSESLGNNHIEIDCRKSDYKYLKGVCIDSLNKHFDLSFIDWDKIYTYCNSSLVIEACKLWEKGFKTSVISNTLKLCVSTVIRYLVAGAKAGLCEYNPEMGKKQKKTIAQYDLNNNLVNVFYSLGEASKKSNLSPATVSNRCNGIGKIDSNCIWKFI